MQNIDNIAQSMAVVDAVLREYFPNDFYKRCMYAAFGLRLLLNDAGIDASIIGGNFFCLVVSDDNSRASLQGFGSDVSDMPSHFWVEAAGVLIDLGPYYLPHESSYPAASMPAIRWPLSTPLPRFLGYREDIRYASNVELQSDPVIMKRMEDFLARCKERSRPDCIKPNLPTWQLKNTESLRFAAQKKDLWACGALSFLKHHSQDALPF